MDGNSLKWYPGHIAKARRKIVEQLSRVDILVEVLDARAPISSDSGIFDEIKGKQIIYIINKIDLVNKDYLEKIKEHFKLKDDVLFISAKKCSTMKSLLSLIKRHSNRKTNSLTKYGFKSSVINVMIVGMPNVGKTEIIRKLSGRKKLQVANRPGVTRNQQWISFKNIRIMDTPGVLYPDFEDDDTVKRLAFLNIIDPAGIGYEIVLEFVFNDLSDKDRRFLVEHYGISGKSVDFVSFMDQLSEKTGINGYENIASKVFSDYNKGCFTQITMDNIDAS